MVSSKRVAPGLADRLPCSLQPVFAHAVIVCIAFLDSMLYRFLSSSVFDPKRRLRFIFLAPLTIASGQQRHSQLPQKLCVNQSRAITSCQMENPPMPIAYESPGLVLVFEGQYPPWSNVTLGSQSCAAIMFAARMVFWSDLWSIQFFDCKIPCETPLSSISSNSRPNHRCRYLLSIHPEQHRSAGLVLTIYELRVSLSL